MRFCYVVAVSMFLFIPNLVLARDVPGTLERHLKRNHKQEYLVYLPQDYNSAKLYPLLIAVHWLGGTDREVLENWYHFSSRDQYILVCPQFKNTYETLGNKEDKTLLSIMDEVDKEFHYDHDKVYLFGCSGGAQFAHRFIYKHPEGFKAVAIIAAGSYSSPPPDPRLAKIKFIVGVGENDLQRLGTTQQFYQELLNQGYDAKLKIFPGVGHGCGIDVQVCVADFFKELQ